MSIQTDLVFTDITLHQAELRREASEARLGRRARTRPSLLERLLHRRSDSHPATVPSSVHH